MPRLNFKVIAAVGLALALGACASKPRPAVEVPQTSGTVVPQERAAEAPEPEVVRSPLQAQLAAEAGDRIYFELDSYELSAEAEATLSRQARWLSGHPGVRIIIAGNCDERGTREYNLALGARRAAAARDHLAKLGVDARRLETVSYGKERPLDPGSNETAWSRNRNAHTQLFEGAAGR